jgi:peptide-methionine (S)-S-oxide reductase
METRHWKSLTVSAYREVCSGRTGHAEGVQLTFQTGSVGYGELVEFFYRTHDPTTVDRQGPDRGSRKL